MVHICMYVLLCMSTPGHTYTGTCLGVWYVRMWLHAYVYTGPYVHRHMYVCLCVSVWSIGNEIHASKPRLEQDSTHGSRGRRKGNQVLFRGGGGAEVLLPHLDHTHRRMENHRAISLCVCVMVHICMYVLVCMSTPGHTYTGTCVCVCV